MFRLILGVAQEDERVRAVILNGSRVNPHAPPDIFQDYDVVYVVTDVAPFVADRSWLDRFGERLIMQTPDAMSDPPGSGDPPPGDHSERFAYLMLFRDGTRIDLTLHPVARLRDLEPDSLSRLLLDKDGCIAPLPPPGDADHRTEPPTETRYAECCNEFLWVSTYVAKGLWRRELPYAQHLYHGPVRDMLVLMLRWSIGVRRGFAVDPGKFGKYFERCLGPEWWARYLGTCAGGAYDDMWRALLAACDLFRDAALAVGLHCGYPYPAGDHGRVAGYLRRVRDLPRDAASVFGD